LAAESIPCRWVAWDDPSVDWASFDAAWIRSTWNYTAAPAEFLAWATATAAVTRLWNPAHVVTWNSHKSYLLDLAARGVAVVPTELIRAGEPVDLAALMAERGWSEVVVKPAVSVGAIGAVRVEAAAAAEWSEAHAEWEAVRGGVDCLVQPLMAGVADGEVSMIVIDGTLTHAVVKVPAAGDFRVHVQYGGQELAHQPAPAERALAEAAVEAVGEPLLYARVDVVAAEDGPRLMELELIEPSLFLALAPTRARRTLTDAVATRL
jgi:glutathione synthase/RimK-type ligase-like ATP-grasp enzyme